MADNMVSLWGRLGVQVDMTPEEFEILKKNNKAAKDLLVGAQHQTELEVTLKI